MMSPRQTLKQVLLVDDNAEIRLTVARSLEMENYVVQTAEHGLEALELLEIFTPDIILSDISMPAMDGIEFYHKVRKNPRWVEIPLIFLTANDSIKKLAAEQALEIDDFLVKPVSMIDLLTTIRSRLVPSEPGDRRHP